MKIQVLIFGCWEGHLDSNSQVIKMTPLFLVIFNHMSLLEVEKKVVYLGTLIQESPSTVKMGKELKRV